MHDSNKLYNTIQMSEDFDKIRVNIINYCKQEVINNWERIREWLREEAEMCVGDAYQKLFSEGLCNDKLCLMDFAGKNLVYALETYVLEKSNLTQEDLLKFAECFINAQMNEFSSWCCST